MRLRAEIVAATMLIWSLAVAPYQARAADQAKVERLIAVLKVDRMMEKMTAFMEQAVEKGFVDSATKRGLTPAQIDRGRPVLVALKKSIDEAFSWDFFKPRIIKLYEEELTNEEIDAALAYYSSPQGQSMLAKQPMLMQRGGEIGMKRGQEMGPKIGAAISAAIEQVRKDELKVSEQEKKDAEKNVEKAEKQVKENGEKMDASPVK